MTSGLLSQHTPVCTGQMPRIGSGHTTGNVRLTIHPSAHVELANRLEPSSTTTGAGVGGQKSSAIGTCQESRLAGSGSKDSEPNGTSCRGCVNDLEVATSGVSWFRRRACKDCIAEIGPPSFEGAEGWRRTRIASTLWAANLGDHRPSPHLPAFPPAWPRPQNGRSRRRSVRCSQRNGPARPRTEPNPSAPACTPPG